MSSTASVLGERAGTGCAEPAAILSGQPAAESVERLAERAAAWHYDGRY